MMLESFPNQPLTSDDVKAVAQQEGIQAVYGMMTGDVTEESHGFDMNIGLNVDGSVDHDFFFDLVIDIGDHVTVAAYPRPDLPSAQEARQVDDPIEVVSQENSNWEVIYQEPKADTTIDDVIKSFNQFRDFSDRERVWVQGLAQSGVLAFING